MINLVKREFNLKNKNKTVDKHNTCEYEGTIYEFDYYNYNEDESTSAYHVIHNIKKIIPVINDLKHKESLHFSKLEKELNNIIQKYNLNVTKTSDTKLVLNNNISIEIDSINYQNNATLIVKFMDGNDTIILYKQNVYVGTWLCYRFYRHSIDDYDNIFLGWNNITPLEIKYKLMAVILELAQVKRNVEQQEMETTEKQISKKLEKCII